MIKGILSFIVIATIMLGVNSCAAKQASANSRGVELVNDKPDMKKCQYVGEIVGSQGNWFTGDFTSNKDLVVGARNELRNEAYKLGANVVYIQDHKNTNAWGSMGRTNTTAVGKAYRCRN